MKLACKSKNFIEPIKCIFKKSLCFTARDRKDKTARIAKYKIKASQFCVLGETFAFIALK